LLNRPLYCPRFINRDQELSALLALARDCAAGNGAVALVSGEAGIGKTRFLSELRKRLPVGISNVGAACLEFAPSPLAPIQVILNALTARSQMPSGPGAILEDALGGGSEGKLNLFQRLCEALRLASDGKPMVVVIDDLQWADTATLELVLFLAGAITTERMLLVLAYRCDELSDAHPLQAVIGRLARLSHVHRFELDPLPQPVMQEFIDATLANRLVLSSDALHEIRVKSEGNPLFAEELLKAAVDRRNTQTVGPPTSLRIVIIERLRKLMPEDLRLLEIGALIGRRFHAAFLKRVSDGKTEATITAFLRLGVAEHFLIEDRAEAGWFVFRHALVRETILSTMLSIELRAMHLRLAQEIEREPDADERVVELSDHYWQAAALAECVRYAVAAADQARARFAFFEAANQYERALACGPPGELERANLHAGAATAHTALGNSQKSVEHLEIGANLFEQIDAHDQVIAACLELSLALRRCGDTQGAFSALTRAAAIEHRRPDEGLRVRILVQLAQVQTLVGDWANADLSLRQAEPLLPLAAPRDLVRFYTSRAFLHFALQDRDEWQIDSQTAARIARASDDPTLVALALTHYGLNALKIGRLDLAIPALYEVVEAAARFGPLYNITFARLGYIQGLFLAGRLSDARMQLNEVLAEGHESVTIRVLAAQLGTSLSLVLRDDSLFARSHPEATLEKAFAMKEPRLSAQLAAAVAEKRLADGDEAGALELLRRMLASLPEDDLVCELFLPVAVCCGRGEVASAAALLAGSRRAPNVYVEACTALFHSYFATRFGNKKAAEQRALSAARQFQELGMPLLEAEAYVIARQVTRATAICERIGARQLQRRLRRTTTERLPDPRLTPREREVVNLATRGLSNKAIATELSLSERTVESHLAAAYVKFGVGSRAELLMAVR